ncbi:MAG: hypothetical protein ACFFAN_02760 [Promethearchaeota archaeon]
MRLTIIGFKYLGLLKITIDYDSHGLEQKGESIVQFIRTVKDWDLLKKRVENLVFTIHKNFVITFIIGLILLISNIWIKLSIFF